MVERVKEPYRTVDGKTFSSLKEAELHEGLLELGKWLDEYLEAMRNSGAPDEGLQLARGIKADGSAFVSLLRKAGVKLIVRERAAKVKPPAEPKKPAKEGRNAVQ